MHGVALRGQLGCPSWPAREHPSDKRRQTSATGVRNLNCMASRHRREEPELHGVALRVQLGCPRWPAREHSSDKKKKASATGVRIMQCRVLSLNASTMFNHTLKECIVGFPIACAKGAKKHKSDGQSDS